MTEVRLFFFPLSLFSHCRRGNRSTHPCQNGKDHSVNLSAVKMRKREGRRGGLISSKKLRTLQSNASSDANQRGRDPTALVHGARTWKEEERRVEDLLTRPDGIAHLREDSGTEEEKKKENENSVRNRTSAKRLSPREECGEAEIFGSVLTCEENSLFGEDVEDVFVSEKGGRRGEVNWTKDDGETKFRPASFFVSIKANSLDLVQIDVLRTSLFNLLNLSCCSYFGHAG